MGIPVTVALPPRALPCPPITVNDRYWQPQTTPQKNALDCRADVLLMGGSAGSLKTSTLLADMVQDDQSSSMKSVVFRKTYPELDEIIEQSRDIYSHMGAIYNDGKHTWRFPAGGFVKFRYIEREKQKYKYQGAQFSSIGFDESTHHEESIIRYLLTRARSPNPNLKIRMRLASNPGNVGHSWHKKLFLHGVCSHCHPGQGAIPGKLYTDRTWMDGTPLSDVSRGKLGEISTAFIPGNLRDHDLLGPRYEQLLKTQNPATAKALLAGCWEIFEGQFFDIWEPNRTGCPMVQSIKAIDYQWWWAHWISCDYGFGISSATASLFCRRPPYREHLGKDAAGNDRWKEWPNGRVYKLSELIKPRMDAVDFTREIVKKWIVNREGKQLERRFHGFYLSPDAGKRTGLRGDENIHTLRDQMNAILQPYGFAFQNAADDRIGGAMRLYTMLRSGELVICSECKETVQMFPTRIHDEDHENDVFKQKGHMWDDVYDDTRYGVYSPNFLEDKPVSERVQEVYDQELDPTSTMIRLRQLQAEIKEEDGPIVYGGKALRDRLADKQRNKSKYRRPTDN